MAEFESFGKIPRLNRDCTITEKLNGTCHPCGAYSNRCTPVRKSRSHLEILVY